MFAGNVGERRCLRFRAGVGCRARDRTWIAGLPDWVADVRTARRGYSDEQHDCRGRKMSDDMHASSFGSEVHTPGPSRERDHAPTIRIRVVYGDPRSPAAKRFIEARRDEWPRIRIAPRW